MHDVWVGVVVDPPNWYNLKDWLDAGCAIRTDHDGYFYEQAVNDWPILLGYNHGLISEEFQPNITWFD